MRSFSSFFLIARENVSIILCGSYEDSSFIAGDMEELREIKRILSFSEEKHLCLYLEPVASIIVAL
jgi:hypothetical protein